MSDEEQQKLSPLAQEMKQRTVAWADALRQGGRIADRATTEVMQGRLGRWIEARLGRQFQFDEDTAEEVTADVIVQFVLMPPEQLRSPYGLLCAVIKNKAIDRLRREQARTPDGGFVPFDAPADEDAPGTELPADDGRWAVLDELLLRQLKDCVREQIREFAIKHAQYARLLTMILGEMSNDEIAAAVYKKDAGQVDDSDRNKIKSMLSTARKTALPYLRRCKE